LKKTPGVNALAKFDKVKEKLLGLQRRLGQTKLYNLKKFALDDLDADTGSDMLREHLIWIQQVKKDNLDSRCKDFVEKLKRLESKIDTVLKEDFDKINMD